MQFLKELGRVEEAKEGFQKCLELDPKHENARFKLAIVSGVIQTSLAANAQCTVQSIIWSPPVCFEWTDTRKLSLCGK